MWLRSGQEQFYRAKKQVWTGRHPLTRVEAIAAERQWSPPKPINGVNRDGKLSGNVVAWKDQLTDREEERKPLIRKTGASDVMQRCSSE